MSDLDRLLDQVLGTPPRHAGAEPGSQAWSALEAAGLTRAGLAESLGGAGGSREDAVRIVIRCAESGLAGPVAEAVLIGAAIVGRAGLAAPAGLISCLIPQRPAQVTATATADGWRLAGRVPGVPWAARADALLAVAETDGSAALAAVVDPRGAAISPGRNLAGEPRDAVRLDGTVVPPGRAAVIPRTAVRDVAMIAALGTAGRLTGASRTCLRLALDYASTRTQFGRRLDAYQVIRHSLAELAGELAASEAAVSSATALAGESGTPDARARLAIMIARVQAARAATRIAAAAHQIHGAIGITREHPLHHFTTRLWSWRDEYGSEHDWAIALAAETAPGDSLWPSLASLSQPG